VAGHPGPFLPDAEITFDKETGGREISNNYLIDNTRLGGIRHPVPRAGAAK
jgi:hypothetical protein